MASVFTSAAYIQVDFRLGFNHGSLHNEPNKTDRAHIECNIAKRAYDKSGDRRIKGFNRFRKGRPVFLVVLI